MGSFTYLAVRTSTGVFLGCVPFPGWHPDGKAREGGIHPLSLPKEEPLVTGACTSLLAAPSIPLDLAWPCAHALILIYSCFVLGDGQLGDENYGNCWGFGSLLGDAFQG